MTVEERDELYRKAGEWEAMGLLHMACDGYTKAGEAGHPEAAFYAGLYYLDGIGIRANFRKALTLFQLSHMAGKKESEAFVALADARLRNDENAIKDALRFMHRFAVDGCDFLYPYLASLYYQNEVIEQNALYAAYYAIQAVKNGSPVAYSILAELYFKGAFLPQNMAFAKYCAEQYRNEVDENYELDGAAEDTDYVNAVAREPRYPRFDDDADDFLYRPCPNRLHQEALCYLYGEGRPIDPDAGKKCLEKAMRYGDTTSLAGYATRIIGEAFEGEYRDADGYICFKPSYQRAKKLFHLGAERYDPNALYALGMLYASGEGGFGRDYEKSKHYFEGHYFYTNSPETKAILDDFDGYYREADAGDYTPIESFTLRHRCPYCGENWTLILTDTEYWQYLKADADDLPDAIEGLSLFEKEFFLSHLCPECQARVFNKICPDLVGRWVKR